MAIGLNKLPGIPRAWSYKFLYSPDSYVSLRMSSPQVHIDFKKMQSAIKAYVRRKAEISGSNIIYVKNGQLIQENPKSNIKTVLKAVFPK